MTNYRPCVVIPCYNHSKFMPKVLEQLATFNLPIFVLDDCSDSYNQQLLVQLQQQYQFELYSHPENLGKGAAIKTALHWASFNGYSHILQVDADGQHNLSDIPLLLEKSKQQPHSLISGKPIYDESVPKIRYYGRYLTHFWVWLETLSFDIQDSLCGFRIYPVMPTLSIIQHVYTGNRMQFDIEIIVQYYWRMQKKVAFIPTKVIYPEEGVSHFDQLWDNVRLTKMHFRLFPQFLYHIPSLLKKKNNE